MTDEYPPEDRGHSEYQAQDELYFLRDIIKCNIKCNIPRSNSQRRCWWGE